MSEEIQGNNEQQQHSIVSDTYKEEVEPPEGQTPQTRESSFLAATPRAGALLVEAYGKSVGKQPAPDKVLFEYAKSLVSFCIVKSQFLFRFFAPQLTPSIPRPRLSSNMISHRRAPL